MRRDVVGEDAAADLGTVTLMEQFALQGDPAIRLHPAPGPDFVVEGDEYDTAFFDKTPKFLHYHPAMLLLTAIPSL